MDKPSKLEQEELKNKLKILEETASIIEAEAINKKLLDEIKESKR